MTVSSTLNGPPFFFSGGWNGGEIKTQMSRIFEDVTLVKFEHG